MTFPLSGASVDMDFTSGQFYSSDGNSDLADQLSISRASVGYAKNSSGVLIPFASGKFRITDLGLLIEDTRENYTDASTTDLSSWSPYHASLGGSTTAPDGTTTATKIVSDSTANISHIIQGAVNTSIPTGLVTFSAYFKAAGYGYGAFRADDGSGNMYGIVVNLSSGSITATNSTGTPVSPSSSTEVLANGWVRLVIALSVSVSSGIQINLSMSDVASPASWENSLPRVDGDGSSGVYVWGAQVEAGAFVSSCILNATGPTVRATDNVLAAGGLNSILAALPHSVLANVKMSAPPNAHWDIVADEQVGLVNDLYSVLSSDNSVTCYSSGGGISGTFPSGILFSTGVKVAFAGSSTARSIVGGGGTVASDTGSFNTMNSGGVGIGSGGSASFCMYGFIRRLTVWNSKLADVTLQGLTDPSYGITDILPLLTNTMSGIARCTVTTGSSAASIRTSALSIYGSAASGVVANQFAGRVVIFDGNTTTAGLRGAQSMIRASSASNTPIFAVDTLPDTPASGDTFNVV